MGDPFVALAETGESSGGREPADDHRRFGLVVGDRDAVAERLADLDVDPLPTSGLEFRGPWGNRVRVVEYGDVQFTKAEHVLRGMDLAAIGKSESALAELREKGIAPE